MESAEESRDRARWNRAYKRHPRHWVSLCLTREVLERVERNVQPILEDIPVVLADRYSHRRNRGHRDSDYWFERE